MLNRAGNRLYDLVDAARSVDFVGPLALRLYLAPVFWVAGMNKVSGFGSVVDWFGNPEWGLGLPFPALMAALATVAEVGGAVLLLAGLGVRLAVVPLMITMVVAATMVHWDNGWQAVHDPMSPYASGWTFGIEAADAAEAGERLSAAESILKQHGQYDWLTGKGGFVVSNSGIEWAATYFVMLLALFFTGAGRYLSLDYWLAKRFRRRRAGPPNGS
ncbi:MAG: DoxX family protein [Gammaproteobacteria bacterium]